MKKIENLGILLFGYIEITIGLVTIISLIESRLFSGVTKPLGVSIFIFGTSLMSLILGCAVLLRKLWARKLLMFFSGYIILTKLFILLGVITLPPGIDVLISSSIRNIISSAYHFLVILFFNEEKVRACFLNQGKLEK